MIIDYFEVRGYFEGHRYHDPKARRYSAIFRNIEEFIDPNKVSIFYPKNMFVDDKDLEIYVFLERKILRGRVLDNNKIEIKLLYLKDLKDFICECTYDEECYYKLTLKFYNDEVIVFDSLVDTNFSWKNKFNKVIKEIIKVIIDKNI